MVVVADYVNGNDLPAAISDRANAAITPRAPKPAAKKAKWNSESSRRVTLGHFKRVLHHIYGWDGLPNDERGRIAGRLLLALRMNTRDAQDDWGIGETNPTDPEFEALCDRLDRHPRPGEVVGEMFEISIQQREYCKAWSIPPAGGLYSDEFKAHQLRKAARRTAASKAKRKAEEQAERERQAAKDEAERERRRLAQQARRRKAGAIPLAERLTKRKERTESRRALCAVSGTPQSPTAAATSANETPVTTQEKRVKEESQLECDDVGVARVVDTIDAGDRGQQAPDRACVLLIGPWPHRGPEHAGRAGSEQQPKTYRDLTTDLPASTAA